jgi:hypothetical protein
MNDLVPVRPRPPVLRRALVIERGIGSLRRLVLLAFGLGLIATGAALAIVGVH